MLFEMSMKSKLTKLPASTKVLRIRNLDFQQFPALCHVFANKSNNICPIDSKSNYMNSGC